MLFIQSRIFFEGKIKSLNNLKEYRKESLRPVGLLRMHRCKRGEGGQEGNGERRNVKAGALEAILAGNSSNHGDLVNALQQKRGRREKEQD